MPSFSGFWGPNVGDYKLLVNRNPRRNAIRRTVNRDGFRVATELFDTLIGAAAGGPAAASHTRVKHMHRSGTPQQGKFVETVVDIDRASTTADVAALKEMVFNVQTRPSYPRDRSGNGGKAFGL